MFGIISSVVKIAASVVGYELDPEVRRRKQMEKLQKQLDELNKAMQEKKVDVVNGNVSNIVNGKPLQVILLIAGLTLCQGCFVHFGNADKVQVIQYIPLEQKVLPVPKDTIVIDRQVLDEVLHNKRVLTEKDVISYTAVDGWFVPTSVFSILSEKAAKWNESQRK